MDPHTENRFRRPWAIRRQWLRLSPSARIGVSFLGLITLGSLLLSLPFATAPGQEALRPVDAFFVSTSAVCVTGLSPVDVGMQFSPSGQAVLLLLIQMGGLGFLTLSTGLLLSMGLRSSMLNQTALVESLSAGGGGGMLRKLLRVVFLTTGVMELMGAIVLSCRFHQLCGYPWAKAAWYGLFHAISAFCNAGFSIFSARAGDAADSLVGFAGDGVTNLTVCTLIILGGLGFPVLDELLRWAKSKASRRLGLHTKIVLTTTGLLLVLGTVAIFCFEYNNPATLGQKPLHESLLASLFQSVTARTAGFNTVNIGALRSQTIMLLIVFMFIGGSPASCTGGIKTTTAFVLSMLVYARIRSRRNPTAFGREIGQENVSRAATLTLLALFFVALLCGAVQLFQPSHPGRCEGGYFMDLLFETISAFGTVGLSTGVTSDLSLGAKLVLTLGMFVGRVGPLTLFVTLAQPPREDRVRLPDEPVVVG